MAGRVSADGVRESRSMLRVCRDLDNENKAGLSMNRPVARQKDECSTSSVDVVHERSVVV